VTDPGTQRLCANTDTVSVSYEKICVGTKELVSTGGVEFYPNPNNGVFNYNIHALSGENLVLNVRNANGQIVYHKIINFNGTTLSGLIDLGSVDTGIYLVYLSNSKGTIVRRLNINR
jgi:hypothetical protein